MNKRHYSMSAETVAARAPFNVIFREVPVMMNWEPELLTGWVVLDKNGDKVFPPSDVGAELICHNCAEELNLVAAKWLMENEGPPIQEASYTEYARRNISRYRK